MAAAAAGLVVGRFIWKTTPSESPSQTAVSSSASQCEQYIDNAKNYMASGDYHSAVGELIDCENATNDDSIISECEDMLVQIISTLKSGRAPRPAQSWNAPSNIRAAKTTSPLRAAPWK